MSKHRRKHRDQSGNDFNNGFDLGNFDLGQMGNLLNNIDPNQLSGLLNNIDMSQLSSMFQGGSPENQGKSSSGGSNKVSGDRRMELLNALKPMVDADKSRLLDSIIQLYAISKIIKK
jgi:hypothetical protein